MTKNRLTLASPEERHCNSSQGKQELLVAEDNVGRPQVSSGLGVSKPVEIDTFSFSALTLLVW